MTGIKQALLALSIFVLSPLGFAFAQQSQPASSEPSILDKAINNPSVDSWSTFGQRQRSGIVRDASVLGERAYRVRISAAGDDPWSVGAKVATTGQINQGDVLLLAYWARVHEPPEGEETGNISSARLEMSASPYTEQFQAPARIAREWRMYYASGVANRAFGPGEASVSLHLAGARQVIDLGPVFVLNFGPNYDVTTLPRNE